MKPRLYMIIPCYNEEKVLPITSEMFLEELNLLITKDKISENSRILFVNDGSKDKTWDLIKELSEKDEHFIGICQSRNRGHQNAVLGRKGWSRQNDFKSLHCKDGIRQSVKNSAGASYHSGLRLGAERVLGQRGTCRDPS